MSFHPFHLVDPSPWPFLGASAAFFLTFGSVVYFHFSLSFFLSLGASLVLFTMVLWWRDVIREASFLGCHTSLVQRGLKAGVLLFILSEVCLFFSFFWAFFHSSLAPTVELGAVWPPRGLRPLDPFAVPLLNTAVLLSSGATVTLAHHSLLSGRLRVAKAALFLTIVLGAVFSFLQATEYLEASFSIADSVFGSVFFVTTGAHGAHVLIGSTFLLICLLRLHHFSDRHHLGFEAAAWYWHFVDVVWLFLFVCMYWWGACEGWPSGKVSALGAAPRKFDSYTFHTTPWLGGFPLEESDGTSPCVWSHGGVFSVIAPFPVGPGWAWLPGGSWSA